MNIKESLKEEFKREIEIANKDIDLMPEQEDYMRGYLGGILCAYRIVFGKNYEESEEDTDQKSLEEWTAGEEKRWNGGEEE